jgi:hypothetical protein
MSHKFIVATTYSEDTAKSMLAWIDRLEPKERKLFTYAESPINEYFNFSVIPHGGKSHFDTRTEFEAIANQFIDRMRQDNWFPNHESESRSPIQRWQWTEVELDENKTKITRDGYSDNATKDI